MTTSTERAGDSDNHHYEITMRVILISTISPYPKTVGKSVVLGGFYDYFKEVCIPGEFKLMSFEPPPLDSKIEFTYLNKPSTLRKLFNVLFLSLLTRKKSLQESFFWTPKALHTIQTEVRKFQPEIIIFDTIRTAQYFQKIDKNSFKSIIYMDDLFSVRYRRILTTMAQFPEAAIDALGNFSSNIPKILLPIYRSSKLFKRILLKIEMNLVDKSECDMPSRFDLALLISNDEVCYIKDRSSLHNIFPISPLLSTNKEITATRSWNGQAEFIFLGSLNLAHNSFSIEYFIEHHMEDMLTEIPNLILRIIGKFPSKNLQNLSEKYKENIVIEGFVEDIDAVLSRCTAMIAPLLFGSGVKIKIIDAVRLGVPVVSTSFGSEGIPVNVDGGIIVTDKLSQFAKIAAQLLNPAINSKHSELSRKIYLNNYSPETVRKQYKNFFHV